MYSKIILNKFIEHKNSGRISKPDGIADIYNADETSHVEFSLRIENDKIVNCQFRAQANPYIIAVCSTIADLVAGSDINEIEISSEQVKQELQDDSNIDIKFCFDCLSLAIQDCFESTGKTKKEPKNKIVEEIPAEPKLQDILNLLNTPITQPKGQVQDIEQDVIEQEIETEVESVEETISESKDLTALGLSDDDFIFDDDDMLDFGVDFLALQKNDKK